MHPGTTALNIETPRPQAPGTVNRHFHRNEPPREVADNEADIKALEAEFVRLLGEVTA